MPLSMFSGRRNLTAVAALLRATGHCLACDRSAGGGGRECQAADAATGHSRSWVGVVQDGKAHYFNYGVASQEMGSPSARTPC